MPYSREHKFRSRERILKSATELFCRYGFDKVSINQVMNLAKMTHGAFYAHFESKEALYKESFLEALKNSRAARLAKAPFSLRHLTQLVTNYLNLRDLTEQSGPGPETILFNDIGSDRSEIKQIYEQSYFSLLKLLETRIVALGKLKKLPFSVESSIVRQRARAIMAMLVGAVAIARSIQSDEERRRLLAAAQDQILVMLGVAEARGQFTYLG
ncbi:MAG TPA: TetR/AcrR family transcriptional regulator [Pseudomonadales bacterium]|nr:TetR/AcrR family transcriptional regulator [Pseudomonadales bacterium]